MTPRVHVGVALLILALAAWALTACGRTRLFPGEISPTNSNEAGGVAGASFGAGAMAGALGVGVSGAGGNAGAGGVGTAGAAGVGGCANVTFADSLIEERVREAISKPQGPLASADFADLRQLSLADEGIIDLGGIECLTALQGLSLENNDLLEIGPIGALTELRTLDLSGNDIDNLDALATLSSLETLDLTDNEITSLEPISLLRGLQTLEIGGNDLRDLSPLVGLAQLTYLDISGNGLYDIGPLAALGGLQILSAAQNAIEDLGPLAGLSQLWRLNLADSTSALFDLSPLASLGSLTVLDLTCPLDTDTEDFPACPLLDVAPLASLPQLQELRLNHCPIASIAPLAQVPTLRSLGLERAFVAEPTPLAELEALTELSVYLLDGYAVDATGLLPLPTSLRKLLLDFRTGHDLDLAAFPNLEELELRLGWSGNREHLLGLETARNLRVLTLYGAQPLPAFTSFPELRSLRMGWVETWTPADVLSLASLVKLEKLEIQGNLEEIDLSPLTSLSALHELRIGGCPANLPELPELQILETRLPFDHRDLETLVGLREAYLHSCGSFDQTLEADLSRLTQLQVLDLGNPNYCNKVYLPEPQQLAALPQLRTLLLGDYDSPGATCGSPNEPTDWSGLEELGELRTLSIGATLGAWPRMPNLRRLTLFTDEGPPKWPDLPRLRQVSVPQSSWEDHVWDAPELEALARFDLTDLSYGTLTGVHPGSLPHLRRLNADYGGSLETLPDLPISAWSELQELELSGSGRRNVRISGHDRLRTVWMSSNVYSRFELDSEAAKLPNLLELSVGTLTFSGTDVLPKLRRLEAFIFEHFDFEGSPELESIKFPLFDAASIAVPTLAQLRWLGTGHVADLTLATQPKLQELAVLCAQDGPPVELSIGEQPRLHSVWVWSCGGEWNAPLASHAFLASLPRVTHLLLESSTLTDLHELELLPHPEKLRHLHLVNYQEYPEVGHQLEPSSFAALATFSNLGSLYLPLGRVATLRGLPSLPSLSVLRLDFAPPSLTGIPSLPSLRSLLARWADQADYSALESYPDLGAGDLLAVSGLHGDCQGAIIQALEARGVSVLCD